MNRLHGLLGNFKVPVNAIADPKQRAQAEGLEVKGEVSLAAVQQAASTFETCGDNPYVDPAVRAQYPQDAKDCRALEKTILARAAEELQLAFTGIGQDQTAGAMDAVRAQLPSVNDAYQDPRTREFSLGDLPKSLHDAAREVHGFHRPTDAEKIFVTLPEVESALAPYENMHPGGAGLDWPTYEHYSNLDALKGTMESRL